MKEKVLEPGRQLYEDTLVDRTIKGALCPLPGTPLWENGMKRPKYVWADMSNPGEEPEIVKEFNERCTRFALRMEKYRDARDEAVYGKPEIPTRWPGIAGR